MQILNKLVPPSKVYIFFISFVLFIIIFSTSFLRADSFKVSDIEISSPFDTKFNKNRVIDSGFENSFFNLISMITTSGDKEKIKKVTQKEIKSMIDSFTISDEKFINDEYFAKLETTFNKKKILYFLEKKNIFPSISTKNKVLLIPILVDTENDKIYLYTNNIFYKKWNNFSKNYNLLEYLLPSEDIEDLNSIQKNNTSIEEYDFLDLINKYGLKDYIITIIFKNKNNIKVLSKINLNNSLKLDNHNFKDIDLKKEKDFEYLIHELKITFEDYWKKNNQINTSIKLPLTLLIDSKKYKEITKLEKYLDSNDLVSDYYVLQFDNTNTFFKIIYNGSPKKFIVDADKKKYTTGNFRKSLDSKMKNLNQLLLNFDYKQNFTDDDFYVGLSNQHTFELLNNWPKWEKKFLNISGAKCSGKSHMIDIFLKKFKGIKFDSKTLDEDKLNITNKYQNIILEDLSSNINEKLLYTLINMIEQDNKFLIITSLQSITEITFKLKDLRSRTKNFLLTKINNPNDELMFALILKNLSDRQITLDKKLINFIIKRIERSYSKIFEFIYKIDRISLKKKKSIDFKIINEALDE